MCSAFLPLVSGYAIRIRVRIRNPDPCPASQSRSVSSFAIRIRVQIRNRDPYTELQTGSVYGFAIRIHIRIHNPAPYPDLQSGSGYRRAKHLQNFVFGCSLLRAEGISCGLDILYGSLGIVKLHFFQLYWIRIQIWIHLTCWIRIRIPDLTPYPEDSYRLWGYFTATMTDKKWQNFCV